MIGHLDSDDLKRLRLSLLNIKHNVILLYLFDKIQTIMKVEKFETRFRTYLTYN